MIQGRLNKVLNSTHCDKYQNKMISKMFQSYKQFGDECD